MTQDAPQRLKPQDVDGCHQLIDELFDAMDALRADKERWQQHAEELSRYIYGQRRERFEDPDQLKLFQSETDEGTQVEDTPSDESSEPEDEETHRPRRNGVAAVVSERVPALTTDSSRPEKPAPPAATESRLRVTVSYVAN